MQSRYKLVVYNKNIYREVDLAPDTGSFMVGTSPECEVRLRKELFFGGVELSFTKINDMWNISCSDGVYLSLGDVRKLITKPLAHGDELVVKYQGSDNEVLWISFTIDFDYERQDYDRRIDVSGRSEVKIGPSADCNIVIHSEYLTEGYVVFAKTGGRLYVVDYGTKYGVYVNGARIQDKKEIGEFDFFSITGVSFYYREGVLYTSTAKPLEFNGLTYSDVSPGNGTFSYPKFNRNTRIQYVVPEDELEIQQAVAKPQKPKKNIVMSLIPTLVMLAMTVVLRGIIGGGGTFVIYSVVSMSIGMVMSLVSFIQEGRAYKKEYAERISTYNKYIDEKRARIAASRTNELRIRNLIYTALENSLDETWKFGPRLFEKSPKDVDFLQIYLGRGRIESANAVKYTKQEFVDPDDPLASIPQQLAEEYRYIEDAPIVSDFNASCGVGVVGSRAGLGQFITNMTLDIACRHFYGEVKFAYLLSGEDTHNLSWVRWLHNVENPALDARNIACDEESSNLLLENLYILLSAREALAKTTEVVFEEYYVVFVTDASALKVHPVSKYIKSAAEYGFTFVFFEEHAEYLPQGCTEIIYLDGENSGRALKTSNGDVVSSFAYPMVPGSVALSAAMRLGAVRVDEVSLEGQLTKNISMFELLGILSVTDLDLGQRWGAAQVYQSMSAPLGVKSKNQLVSLDISDKASAHGPHGLVAGTTGSGKSEILQTYILSMASLYHPYEVGFVIIDFKGGGMANQFKALPHLIGTITNIDGREINRSLLSIKAELVKRQELFSQHGVNHIDDYIRLYKAGRVDTPLPHLIMIVDEFAELKAEHPDFMKELISAARIGRTLGVHLILATQKPAGVVDAQIWSNSKFRLCLKVQTKEDSNEVIKTPLAAEIVEPGRAYFQVGNNEIFDLFQSAYSGGGEPSGSDANERIYDIYERNLWGKKTLVYTNRKRKSAQDARSQLQAIVEYIGGYCGAEGIRPLPGICLPALPAIIRTTGLDYGAGEETDICIPIGVFDDPEQQRQEPVNLVPSRDNTFIVGSAQTGKTVMLQTIVYGLLRKYDPSQVQLYLIDCGSMVLRIFEEAAHVGGVVLSSEGEKCRNLFKLLNTTIVERKKLLSDRGVGNFAAYLEAGHTDMPMIVVALDNIAAFKEYYPDQADEIGALSREAQGVGISLIITAPTSASMSYRTQANFGRKFVLNCNDTNEYSNVLGHCRETPSEYPGRGLLAVDRRILEFQTAIFGKSDKEADRSGELRAFIAERNQGCSTQARPIPMVPERLDLPAVFAQNGSLFRNKGILPIGMDYATVDYSLLNLGIGGSLALLGDGDSKERFMASLLFMLGKTIIVHEIEAFIIDDKAKVLAPYSSHGFVRQYTTDTAEALSTISDFCSAAERRRDGMESGGEAPSAQLLILNNLDVFRRICADRDESKRFATLVKNAGDAGVFLLMANVDNQTVGFNSSDVLKAVRDERRGILFAPLAESRMFEVSGRVKTETDFDRSVGYRFDSTSYCKIKIFDV